MPWSERLIKFRDSWFSPKYIEVEHGKLITGGRALDGLGVLQDYQTQPNSEFRLFVPLEAEDVG